MSYFNPDQQAQRFGLVTTNLHVPDATSPCAMSGAVTCPSCGLFEMSSGNDICIRCYAKGGKSYKNNPELRRLVEDPNTPDPEIFAEIVNPRSCRGHNLEQEADVIVFDHASPTAGNAIPLSPEALYELKLDTVRRFVNYILSQGLFVTGAGTDGDVDFVKLYEGFLKGDTK